MQELLFSRPAQKRAVRYSFYCIVSMFLLSIVNTQGVFASPSQAQTPSIVLPDLNMDASTWGEYHDGGNNTGTISNVGSPSLDGHAIRITLQGGEHYTGFHAFRTLPQINATTFTLSLSFYFTDQATIQGLEFTMDRWHQGRRLEWAVQWEQYGDGTLQQGVAPTWRAWTGQGWQNIGLIQPLALSTWHTLYLIGDIFQGKVRYLGFGCDNLSSPVSLIFPATPSNGEKVVVGAQIDGNAREDPAQVYLDKVNLSVQ